MAIVYLPIQDNIMLAAKQLEQGNLICLPTDTIYGLAANANSDEAVEKIFKAKERPYHKRLSVFVKDIAQAQTIGKFDERALRLAEKFWPGALTIVVPLADDCPLSKLATNNEDTVAIRIPQHGAALSLLAQVDFPVIGTSANVSGHESAKTAEEAMNNLCHVKDITMVLDGGVCDIGVESTIIDATGDELKILRQGALTAEELLVSL